MNLKGILSFFSLDETKYNVSPTPLEDENQKIIFASQIVPVERECPFCHSHNVVINGNHVVTIKNSVFLSDKKEVIVKMKRYKLLCKDCKHNFYLKDSMADTGRSISNDTAWAVHDLSSLILSFKNIGKILKISTPTVIACFDQLVRYKRKPFSRSIAIDEKRFTTAYGKYICVISDAENGDILDIIQDRSLSTLFPYFRNIPIKEREKVDFFATDMYEGYRTICQQFFPNAIQIIDHFHVKNLFEAKIQSIINRYLKVLDKESFEYMFANKFWRTFLVDKYLERKHSDKEKETFTLRYPDGERIDKI